MSAALFVVLAALAFLMLGPGAPSYNIKVYFLNAAQLVKGNDVQIAGTKVGTVQDLAITPNGQGRGHDRDRLLGLHPAARGHPRGHPPAVDLRVISCA